MDKFYKFLKLSNGEDIIATTDSNCENIKQHKTILVYDPVLISTIRIAQGPYYVETFTMQPWIKLAKDDIIELPTESIVVAVDIDDKFVYQYETFLNEYSQTVDNLKEQSQDTVEDFLEELETEDTLYEFENDKESGPTLH